MPSPPLSFSRAELSVVLEGEALHSAAENVDIMLK
jgi:hypothetical protein